MVRGLEQTNRVSIDFSMIIERSGMNECVDPMMELLIDFEFDKFSENGSNIYE